MEMLYQIGYLIAGINYIRSLYKGGYPVSKQRNANVGRPLAGRCTVGYSSQSAKHHLLTSDQVRYSNQIRSRCRRHMNVVEPTISQPSANHEFVHASEISGFLGYPYEVFTCTWISKTAAENVVSINFGT